MKRGRLIVIEGTDGAGKTTQIELLEKYLEEKGIPFEVINFPRYEDNEYGKLIRRYLEGEFGSISEVNPYLMSLAYAGDRMLAAPLIEKWLAVGKMVIVNRYASSNKAHMGASLPSKNRKEFFSWLDELEYKTNGIPKEDMTILLLTDPKLGQENVVKKHKPDIHEKNLSHLKEANKIYLELAKTGPNWVVVNCMEDNKMTSKEDIHRQILHILSTKIPLEKIGS